MEPSPDCPPPTQDNAPHGCLVPVTTALGQLKRGDVPPWVPRHWEGPSAAPLLSGKCLGAMFPEMALAGAGQVI